jgi:hypothetical protein
VSHFIALHIACIYVVEMLLRYRNQVVDGLARGGGGAANAARMLMVSPFDGRMLPLY